ncbi:MAG: hypothetical protein LBS16_05625 [Prevotellaceae bacterium]|jgi:hypothetical protein|nr:hypothetical protein [Prevotellaceae bacterium]
MIRRAERLAAAKAMLPDRIMTTAVIERENGVVTAIYPMEQLLSEPPNTRYYSGLITAEATEGLTWLGYHIAGVEVGYRGRLLLFEHFDGKNMQPLKETTCRIL